MNHSVNITSHAILIRPISTESACDMLRRISDLSAYHSHIAISPIPYTSMLYFASTLYNPIFPLRASNII